MANVKDTEKSKAEIAAIAGGYIDAWRAGVVEGMGSACTIIIAGSNYDPVLCPLMANTIKENMLRRFPDHAPQEIERRKL